MCFLAKQELPFRDHGENKDSNKKGNYSELLMLLAKRDDKFQHHLETSTAFSVLSSDIHNDIVEAILTYMINETKSEVKKVKFVSVIMDQSTDVSEGMHLSTVLRYLSPGGEIRDCETRLLAKGFYITLQESDFNFLLNLFSLVQYYLNPKFPPALCRRKYLILVFTLKKLKTFSHFCSR